MIQFKELMMNDIYTGDLYFSSMQHDSHFKESEVLKSLWFKASITYTGKENDSNFDGLNKDYEEQLRKYIYQDATYNIYKMKLTSILNQGRNIEIPKSFLEFKAKAIDFFKTHQNKYRFILLDEGEKDEDYRVLEFFIYSENNSYLLLWSND